MNYDHFHFRRVRIVHILEQTKSRTAPAYRLPFPPLAIVLFTSAQLRSLAIDTLTDWSSFLAAIAFVELFRIH